MPGTITLTTDFGNRGPFVGVMKAVILRHAPETTLVDLTHGIHPGQIGEAGFWLSRAWHQFPPGSVHVAVVDPGVGTSRRILAAICDDHVFIAPDNGLLTMIPELRERGRWHELTESWRIRQGWPEPSRTFHGRDIMAPLAAAIASRRARIEDIGPLATDVVPPALPDPVVSANTVRGQVAAIDTWGNLISNIDESLLLGLDTPAVEVRGHHVPLVGTYGEAAPGALAALVNSFGVIEIACNQGNAAQVTGATYGDPVVISGRAPARNEAAATVLGASAYPPVLPTFAQVSRSVTMRLKAGRPGFESTRSVTK
jgi:hypothetical protein